MKSISRPALQLVSSRAVPDSLDALLDAGYRYSLSLTHDPAEAEDLVQDASLAVLASGAAWERSYLFVTIRNRFIDRCRRNRRVSFVALEEGDGEGNIEDLDWEAPDVLREELLDHALGMLRVEEREALYLAIVEGYTADEIGRMTEHPRGTVLSLLYRAKKKLRALLEKEIGAG
jgi:RNA polymerase sigma-70 factor (ECF subfamily)